MNVKTFFNNNSYVVCFKFVEICLLLRKVPNTIMVSELILSINAICKHIRHVYVLYYL